MLRKLFILFFILVTVSSAWSQLKKGDHLLGPTIGFWAYGEAPTFGFNYEYQLEQLGDVSTISLGGIFRYTAYRYSYPHDDYYDYTYTTLGLQSNFNFNKIGDGKFVPFAGLVLGFNNVNSTYYSKSGAVYEAGYSDGWWMWVQGGMRYFFSQSVAGVLRIGLGNFHYNVIELGVDFKL